MSIHIEAKENQIAETVLLPGDPLRAKFNRKALSVLTVSDHIITGELTSAQERQTTFNDMIEVALEAAIKE